MGPVTITSTTHPTIGNYITYKANPGDGCQGAMGQPKVAGSCRVKINGENTRSTGVDLSQPLSFIRIEGFEISDHRGDGVTNFKDWYANAYQTNGNVFINNYIHNNSENGVNSMNSLNAVVENNELYANGLSAIRFGGELTSDGLRATGNNIHYNEKDGIQGGGINLTFEYNRIYDQFHTEQHQDCFDIGSVTNGIFRYNTVSDCTQLLYISAFPDAPFVVNHVEIYGNVFYNDQYWTASGGETQGVFITSSLSRAEVGTVQDVRIHSNTFGWLGYSPIWIEGDNNDSISGVKIYNNIYAHNENAVSTSVDTENNLSVAVADFPLYFKNYVMHQSYEFQLKATALKAIDKGGLGSIPMPANFRDIDGNLRPRGVALDIGAYEY